MHATPEQPNGWWISPAIPTIANVMLAVLWLFSTLGGWGDAAFCGEGADHDATCSAGFGNAVLASVPPAAGGLGLGIASWTLPAVRHRPERLDRLLTVAAVLWVAAEAVLFVGGFLAQR